MRIKKYKAKSLEDTESVSKGDIVEGYMNSFHLMGSYTMQVEQSTDVDVEGCSGIVVEMVLIDIDTLTD